MKQGILSGKRGVVLGVANERSIACGCAKACLDADATLAFNYASDAIERRVREWVGREAPGSPVFACDVTRDEDIANFFAEVRAEWDTLDFVVHSVAFANREDLRGRFVDTSRDGFALALDVSTFSLVAVAREAARMMPEGGSIVSMTYYGSEKVMPQYNVMGVAKAALEAASRYLAHDLGPQGIRVNCISAGAVKTLASSAIPGMRDMLGLIEQSAPLRRNVTQEDIGRTCVYLVSDLSSAVTGDIVHVDCGFHALGLAVPQASPNESANVLTGNPHSMESSLF